MDRRKNIKQRRGKLKSLKKRKDIVMKAADKGGAVVVWRADLYQKEALRQLSDTSFYFKVDKDLTLVPTTLPKKDWKIWCYD